MDFLSLIIISVVLSIDSFTASVSTGLCMPELKTRKVLKVALFLGVFQAVMPLLGWLAGIGFKSYIENIDHWIAFILLSIIGGKMIIESRKKQETNECYCPSNTRNLIAMSIATTIDAFVVGIGFGLLQVQIFVAMLIIGVVTVLFSLSGIWIGNKIGNKFNKGLEVIGGIVLIGLGVKILVEHLWF